MANLYPHLQVYGHDQSSFLISLARERANYQKLTRQTNFTVGDCREIPYDDQMFDIVLVLGNSFGYFSDNDSDKKVLDQVLRVLKPGGIVVLDITDGEYMRSNYVQRAWEWVDDSTFVCRERQLSKDNLRLISREIVTVANRGVVRDQFYQERLYGRLELENLAVSAGLDPIAQPQTNNVESVITVAKELSKLKDDLGMMEQRILFLAKKPLSSPSSESENSSTTLVTKNLENVSISAELPSISDMVILLGDATQPCVGKLNDTWNSEDLATRQILLAAISSLGFSSDAVTVLDNHESFHRILAAKKPSFVFNLCDEGFNNDALKELHVPAILDMLNIPYSGAGPNCLAYCYDKGLVNRTAEALGVPTPKEILFLGDSGTPAISSVEKLDAVVKSDIKYPAFIKPVKGDNSLGITPQSIVNNKEDLSKYLSHLKEIGIVDVLVQEYLQGTEYGVGVIGNIGQGFHFFPILEVDYSNIIASDLPPILGFDSKWNPSSPYWTDIVYKKAEIPKQVESRLHAACISLWERFGCRDYARFDFRADNGSGYDQPNSSIKLLEVNPNPGWCWDGKLAHMGRFEGKEYHEILGMILEASWGRICREIQN